MDGILNVSSTPHTRSSNTTQRIMMDVCIALIPASAVGIYVFGVRALLHIIITIFSCIAVEAVYEYFMKKQITVNDFSAVVTGLLLALNLPASAPLWMGALGGAFAILIVKQLFGGLGQNFMNPALGARCFLLISFTSAMTDFSLDGVSGATPLAVLKSGGAVNVLDMFLGTIRGTIGETSVLALLIGAIYLLVRKVIDIRIPFFYLLTFVVFIILFGGHGFDVEYIAAQLCGGGLMLGAFFMATDYATSPVTKNGRIIFGICLGVLTGVFRIFGASAEGVSYAIIFTNLLVPLIERFTIPKAFGREGK
ncbi:MAG: RnfABCDGE type electron transport complex subunit D [Eubacterium sp.]